MPTCLSSLTISNGRRQFPVSAEAPRYRDAAHQAADIRICRARGPLADCRRLRQRRRHRHPRRPDPRPRHQAAHRLRVGRARHGRAARRRREADHPFRIHHVAHHQAGPVAQGPGPAAQDRRGRRLRRRLHDARWRHGSGRRSARGRLVHLLGRRQGPAASLRVAQEHDIAVQKIRRAGLSVHGAEREGSGSREAPVRRRRHHRCPLQRLVLCAARRRYSSHCPHGDAHLAGPLHLCRLGRPVYHEPGRKSKVAPDVVPSPPR